MQLDKLTAILLIIGLGQYAILCAVQIDSLCLYFKCGIARDFDVLPIEQQWTDFDFIGFGLSADAN